MAEIVICKFSLAGNRETLQDFEQGNYPIIALFEKVVPAAVGEWARVGEGAETERSLRRDCRPKLAWTWIWDIGSVRWEK